MEKVMPKPIEKHPISKSQNVPRYTSYPTAPQFHEGVNGTHYSRYLQGLNDENALSLYFHIPFCHQLCWFCGCHTQVINSYKPVGHYLGLLKQEIRLVANHLGRIPVRHIHFGGGSPTMLQPADFLGLFETLHHHFHIATDAEIAIEIDPRSVDEEKIKAYQQAGVVRASLGVQDFHPEVQHAINRIQPYEVVRGVIESLRTHGIDALNLDLIYGLPYQTRKTFSETIDKVLGINPNRISLFGYAHVPWMKKHQRLIPQATLPYPELRLALRDLSSDMLVDADYSSIGLDHYALKDDDLVKARENKTLRRNFQGYTTDQADSLLGFGISSIGALPTAYMQNISDGVGYEKALKAGQLPIKRGLELSSDDLERRDIIMSLMCYMQATIKEEKYQRELNELQPFIASGMVHVADNVLTVADEARWDLRRVACVFDSYLHQDGARYSQAV